MDDVDLFVIGGGSGGGRATLADAHTVRLAGGRKVRAKQTLIATGAAPRMLQDIPGAELASSAMLTGIERHADALRVGLDNGASVPADAALRALGCYIVGAEAAEMIQLMGVALTLGATKQDLDATLAVHPTATEELVKMRVPTRRHAM